MRPLVRLSAAGVILALLVLMLTPSVTPPGPDAYADKIWHVIGFFAIALSLQVAGAWRDRLGAALLAVLIGAGVEVVQDWVGRERSVADLIADAGGATLAFLAAPALRPLLDWLRPGSTKAQPTRQSVPSE